MYCRCFLCKNISRRVKFFPVSNLSRATHIGMHVIHLTFLMYVQVQSIENYVYAHIVIITMYRQGPDVGKRIQNFEENRVWGQKTFFFLQISLWF